MSRVAPPRSMAVAAECRSRLAPFVGAAMPAFPTNLVNAAQNASENKDMHSPNCWRVLYGVFKICLRERAGQRPVTALYYRDKFGFVNQVCRPGLGLFCSSRSTAVGPRARARGTKRVNGGGPPTLEGLARPWIEPVQDPRRTPRPHSGGNYRYRISKINILFTRLIIERVAPHLSDVIWLGRSGEEQPHCA